MLTSYRGSLALDLLRNRVSCVATDRLLVLHSDVSPTLKCQRSTALRPDLNPPDGYPEHDIWSDFLNIDNRSNAAADGSQSGLDISKSLNGTEGLDTFGPVSDGLNINESFDINVFLDTAEEFDGGGISVPYQHDMYSWQELELGNVDYTDLQSKDEFRDVPGSLPEDSIMPAFVFPSTSTRYRHPADLR